jgi:hypothetical protein
MDLPVSAPVPDWETRVMATLLRRSTIDDRRFVGDLFNV